MGGNVGQFFYVVDFCICCIRFLFPQFSEAIKEKQRQLKAQLSPTPRPLEEVMAALQEPLRIPEPEPQPPVSSLYAPAPQSDAQTIEYGDSDTKPNIDYPPAGRKWLKHTF